ncbi:MAG: phosphopentomutase [Anaerolineaceae bacterium]|nr:phosphopentomutase [Anaerolineaceae bacterium]
MFKRITVIVLDGVGIGEAPDAADYGDVGSNSIANTARVLGGMDLPNMGAIGLGNVTPIEGVPPTDHPQGGYGKMQPYSAGKDTISGHWEMMGIYLPDPFPTYPNGFPPEIMEPFEREIGRGTLANRPASGTEIIKELGEEHVRTGKPIVYTSADSVFQIAAHEDVIPVPELYEICKVARKLLVGKHGAGRVIARPFVGTCAEDFKRTDNRRDFARTPETDTVLDKLYKAGLDVWSVGKIDDIFVHRGITRKNHTLGNAESIKTTLNLLDEPFHGLLFVNLIEFDMIYGHRNDPKGYYSALKGFDDAIPEFLKRMTDEDLVLVSADHGVDPTTKSTDHSREYVPLLAFGPAIKGVNLGTRQTFGDLGATVAENFGVEPPLIGTSFLEDLT